MLAALTALLICQLAGEAVVQAAHLPLPGPVLGMAMLAVLMLVRSPLPRELDGTANGLLRHLALLFVPAGVGVVQQMGRLGSEGLRLLLVLILSTVIALAVTALTFEYLARLMRVDEAPADHEEAP
jgi:holin-like protein